MSDADIICLQARIHGRVQGVFFRDWTHPLVGWGLQPHPERFRRQHLAAMPETFRSGLQTPTGEGPVQRVEQQP